MKSVVYSSKKDRIKNKKMSQDSEKTKLIETLYNKCYMTEADFQDYLRNISDKKQSKAAQQVFHLSSRRFPTKEERQAHILYGIPYSDFLTSPENPIFLT